MLKAVIFDLDGTLIDSTEAIVQSFMHTFDVLGYARPERAEVVRTIGFTLEQHFELFTKHDPHECARIYRAHYGAIALDLTTMLPGCRETLDVLRARGLKLGFATSKQKKYADLILDHLGVLGHFDSCIGPDEVTHPKPHPEAVLTSLAHLDVSADEALFVGDTDFDVKAAHAAGVRCLCVTTGYNTREQLEALNPAGVFETMNALTEHLLASNELDEADVA